jgi:type I restriction enzyme S subunit
MQLTVDSGQLPVGWEVKKLGEVCNISTGKLNANAAVENGKYPFFTCSREIFTIDYFAFDCEAILLAGNNAVGDFNVKHYKGKFNAYQRTYVITINKEETLLYKYLYLQVENALKDFKLKSVGAGTKFLKLDMIKNLKLHLPPLPEQKRIVAIADEAFEGIDRAIRNTEKNLSNARELFESYLNSIFTQKGDGWKNEKLGDICENLDSKRIPITKSKRQIGSVPYYGASGIVDYVADFIFNENLLLVSEDGANLLARTYPIAFSISGKTWVNNHAHVLRFREMRLQKFVEYYLNSISLASYVSGMAQPKLNQKALNSISVPLAPKADRERIIENLDVLTQETQRLENIYRQKIAALKELKQSILQKAFTGELTADKGEK